MNVKILSEVLVFTLTFLLLTTDLIAQQEDFDAAFSLAVPPSPEAASLGQYGAYPVNLSSGTPNISIPFYEVVSGSLRVPVSMNYNASGIRVSQQSGRVGLGWSLNAGGVVTRTMRGLPDEEIGSGFLDAWSYIKDVNLGDGGGDEQTFYTLKDFVNGQKDSEPDQFFYNIISGGGQLIFDNDAPVDDEGNVSLLPIPYSPVKALFDRGSDEFKITDANGTVYQFANIEKTQIDPIVKYSRQLTIYTSSWFLTSITSADGKDQITFEYYTPENIPSIPSSYREQVQFSQTIQKKMPEPPNELEGPLTEDCSYVVTQIIDDRTNVNPDHRYIPQFLHKIKFKGGQIRFEGAPYLSQIVVESVDENGQVNNVPIKTFDLNFTSYISPDGENCQCNGVDIQYKSGNTSATSRKILRSIKESGKGFYNFEYYENALFPHDKSFDQDHWGYFNNAGNTGNFVPEVTAHTYTIGNANRASDGEAMKAWTLKSIKYPTGGETVFDFEPHLLSTLVDKVDVANINSNIEVTGLSTFPDYDNKTQNSASVTIVPVLTGDEEYGNLMADYVKTKFTVTIEKINGINTGEGAGIVRDVDTEQVVASFNWKHPDHQNDTVRTNIEDIDLEYGKTYQIEVWSNYDLVKVTTAMDVELQYISDLHKKIPVGGLRVKSIKNYDRSGNQLSQKNFHYDESKTLNGHTYDDWGTGELTANVQYQLHYEEGALYYQYRTNNYYIPCGDLNGGINTCWDAVSDSYLIFKSGITTQLGSSTVVYNKVTEEDVDGEGLPNGKTVSHFNTPQDKVSNHYPYPPAVDNDWARGLLLKKETFEYKEGDFVLKERITNDYELYESDLNYESIEARKYGFSESYVSTSGGGYVYYDLDQFMMTPVHYTSQWQYLKSAHIEKYDDQKQVTLVEYTYNDKNIRVSEQVTHLPDGDVLIQETKYPSDYTIISGEAGANKSGIALDFINEHYIENLPIEQRSYVISKGTAEKKLTSLGLNIYNLNAANFLVPYETFRWEGDAAVINDNLLPKAIRDGFNVYIHWASDDIEKVRNYSTDYYGNINRVFSNGFSQSYLWSQNHQLLAKADNARPEEIAYTSFESSDKGNWVYNGFGSTFAGHIFGNKAYAISNGEISKSLDPEEEYILSYWYQGDIKPAVTTVGGSAIFLEDGITSIGEWKLCKYLIVSTTSVSLINGGIIDELKIRPKNSSLTTYIHEPLIGPKCISDDTDLPTFFKYNNGFLESVYDHEMNMLRKFDYNFQNN